jgi:hypothetical protein
MSNLISDWHKMLTAELWDIITLEVRLPNGDVLEQRSMIEGIEISTPSRQDWKVFWWLSLPTFSNLLSDDDADFEGADLLGTIGGWTAETNCTLVAQDEQVEQLRHGGGRNHLPISYTYDLKPVYANHGAWVLQADATSTGNLACLSPTVAIEPRRNYDAKAFLRNANFGLVAGEPSADNPATGIPGTVQRGCSLQLDWLDASLTHLSTDIGAVVTVSGKPITDWTAAKVSGRAPDAAAFVKLRVSSVGTGKVGLYVDNVSVKRGG